MVYIFQGSYKRNLRSFWCKSFFFADLQARVLEILFSFLIQFTDSLYYKSTFLQFLIRYSFNNFCAV
jgi:hypothetical protein